MKREKHIMTIKMKSLNAIKNKIMNDYDKNEVLTIVYRINCIQLSMLHLVSIEAI